MSATTDKLGTAFLAVAKAVEGLEPEAQLRVLKAVAILLPPPSAPEAEPPATVHYLRNGAPLCGFSTKLPGDWPAGHTWVSSFAGTTPVVNCAGCTDAFQATLPKEGT